MTKPLVSVIMPENTDEQCVQEAVTSIKNEL